MGDLPNFIWSLFFLISLFVFPSDQQPHQEENQQGSGHHTCYCSCNHAHALYICFLRNKAKPNISYAILVLMHFSCVRLCATPQMAAHQAPPSLGFSRQEHWSGLPFPSPMRESEVAQSCLTLSDPMDRSLPDSSICGIFQARALEWGAIAFSEVMQYIDLKYIKLWMSISRSSYLPP